MECPNCHEKLNRVKVKVQGARQKVTSYQCSTCDYFEFEPVSSQRVIQELREAPLKIKQKVIKLSQDRLGIYFNTNIIRSLDLQQGEDIYVSVPDKKHIVIEREA